MKIRWGMVGVGRHADRSMAPAIKRDVNSELVAVCDIELETVQAFAAKHDVKKYYSSFDEFLNNEQIDAVYISTPNNLHAQQTIKAAQAGKHIMCEKPMALNVKDCELMIHACEKANVRLGINFQNRHHPAHVEAKRLIEAGEVGQITLATAQYCHGRSGPIWVGRGWRNDPTISGAGALMATGLHCLDLLRYLLGSEVTEVRAFTDEHPPERPVDEMDLVLMEFANAAHASVISGFRVFRSNNDMVLYGTKAKLTGINTVGMPLQGELLIEKDGLKTKTEYSDIDPYSGNYMLGIESFNRAVSEGKEPLGSGKDGLELVRISNAILESSRSGKVVKIEHQV